MPANSTSSIGGPAWSRTRYSWNSRQPSGVRTRVLTGSSHIGRTVARDSERAGQLGGDGREAVAAVEPPSPLQAESQVAVGEPEPVRGAEAP